MPNRFLASLAPFLERHRHEPQIRAFLIDNFRRFFRRNVALYHRPDLKVNFVGGIANTFTSELAEAARQEGITLGHIIQRPIEQMADFLLPH